MENDIEKLCLFQAGKAKAKAQESVADAASGPETGVLG
jgi:hypothetical protein